MKTLSILRAEIRANWRKMILTGVAFALLFQIAMLVALMVRFQALPNYTTFYDWPEAVAVIVQSTPSFRDMAPIIWEEWLIEIGRMNYDYGTGISEWSLNVIPSRLLVLFVVGAMVSLALSLVRRDTCDARMSNTLRATTGVGTLLIAMTNATMSWVVCCATPTWVVGLAMLGLGVSSSLALEQLGPVLSGAGFVLLIAIIIGLAWHRARSDQDHEGVLVHA